MRFDTRNPFTALLTLIAGAVLLVAGLAFSLILFAVLAAAGFLIWAWFWWNTRALRRHMREQMQEQQAGGYAPAQAPAQGIIIEGEIIREADPRTPTLPNDASAQTRH